MSSLLLLLPLLLAAPPEMIPPDDEAVVGRTAPEVELPLRGGGAFRLSAERGKVVVLSFWASWCGPCRQELPALAKLHAERPELVIVAINVDRDAAAAEGFLRQVKAELPVALDPESKSLGLFGALSMPTSLVVDRNGTVKLQKAGYSQDKGLAELLTAIEAAR